MSERTINIPEKSLGDLIKQSFDLLKTDKPITFDNGELDKPIHMDPAPYEPNDEEHCPFCGEELEDGHDVDGCKKEFRRIDVTRKSLP